MSIYFSLFMYSTPEKKKKKKNTHIYQIFLFLHLPKQ